MGEFFKGWRRKTGVVTLVMACVFTGGWVRSYRGDYFQLFSRTFFSNDGAIAEIGWGRPPSDDRHPFASSSMHFEKWRCPYYLTTVPLTLLSVYLLLARPRVAKPQKTIEPASAEGT